MLDEEDAVVAGVAVVGDVAAAGDVSASTSTILNHLVPSVTQTVGGNGGGDAAAAANSGGYRRGGKDWVGVATGGVGLCGVAGDG